MKAIAIQRGNKINYFSSEEKALAFLSSRSNDGKVYNKMMDEVAEMYINDNGGTSYYITANNGTIFDALGISDEQKEEYNEYNVTYINIE